MGCCCYSKPIPLDHPHGGVMTVHKYVGSPHWGAKMMMIFGTMDAALLKTGMNEDFSGKLNHDNLLKLRDMMDKDM